MKHIFLLGFIVLVASFHGLAQHSVLEAKQKVVSATDRVFLSGFSKQQTESMSRQLEKVGELKEKMLRPDTDSSGFSQWVAFSGNGHPLVMATANLTAAKTVSTDKVWPGGSMGLNLTGNGITLAIWDGGKVRSTHQEFGGRVTQKDGASSLNGHATHVAGTMVAAGVVPQAKGMSFEAHLDAYDWLLDVAEMSAAASDGLLISNHSYRFYAGWQADKWYGDTTVSRYEDNGFGLYHSSARNLDLIANHAPYYLMCFAASNDRLLQPSGGVGYVWDGTQWIWSNTVRPANGPYDCIPYFNTAKNILTIGNVLDIPGGYNNASQVVLWTNSSCGPTDDGRIKPDIVANGYGVYSTYSTGDDQYNTMTGTSMSTPNTSGSLGLLQQHAFNLFGEYMKATTLKALVIHTADEAGAAGGPDYQFGWGLLNTASAAGLMLLKDSAALITENTLQQGQTFSLPVYCDGTQPLKATIVWNDPAGEESAWVLNPTDLRLVNDLDMRITRSSSTWEPYILDPSNPSNMASTGDNFRDNVEQISIAAPEAGVYTIEISHKATLSGGMQEFSLIVSGITSQAPVRFTAEAAGDHSVELNWSLYSGMSVLVAWSADDDFGEPVAGTTYQPGDVIAGGGTVLYSGDHTTYSHDGLTGGTRYYYRIWSVTGGAPDYSTSAFAEAVTQCSPYYFPLNESFSSGETPPCWTIENDGTVTGFYYSNTTYGGGSSSGEMIQGYENINGVNNSSNAPNATSRLILPPLNTVGMNQLTLQFTHTFRDSETWNGLAPATARIQTSSDGTNWSNESWSMATRSGSTFNQVVTTTLTQNLNQAETYVAFALIGDPADLWYWAIDDVKLLGPSGWWSGNAGTGWNSAANWADETVPGAAIDVTVPAVCRDFPVVETVPATAAECNNLTLEPGATLSLAEGKALTVNGVLSNPNGADALQIGEGASLLHYSDGVQATVLRTVTGGTDYHYVSSPVVDPTAGSVFPLTAYVRRYDETQAEAQWVNLVAADQLASLTGYATYMPEGTTIATFSGPLHNGSLSLGGLTFTSNSTPQYDGFNLVGNPYPSAIDLESDQVGWTHLGNTAYFWDQTLNAGLGGYASYTAGSGGINGATQYVGPAQGFFVKVDGAGNVGEFLLNNQTRIHAVPGFFKEAPADQLRFRVSTPVAGGELSDELIVGIAGGASAAFDPKGDALQLTNPGTPAVSTPSSDGFSLAVQNLGSVDEMRSLPVNLLVPAAAVYTMNIGQVSTFGASGQLWMEDLTTGFRYDLRSTASFSFDASPADIQPRFRLWFGAVGIDEPETSGAICRMNGDRLEIYCPGSCLVEVFNDAGQMLARKSCEGSGWSHLAIAARKQVLIVRLTTGNRIKVFKIVR